MKKLSFLALVLFVPGAALAANNWTVATYSGTAVMDEVSTLTFTVSNARNSTNPMNLVTLRLPTGTSGADYIIEGGIAPRGWQVSTVDRRNRAVTFIATGTCPSKGLARATSAQFGVKVTAISAATDLTGDAIVASRSDAEDTCTRRTFNQFTGTASWPRVGLGAQASVSPRTLDLDGTVTLTLAVTNRSTVTQSAIAPTVPVTAGTATFAVVTGPTPTTLSLPVDATGTFTWTLRATGRGTSTLGSSARNTAVSSPVDVTLPLNVGAFPAYADLAPQQVASGSIVTASLTVSNNSSDPYQNVAPSTPTFAGTAVATLVSGPTPASVATLSAGSSTRFSWTYRITGLAGDQFQMSGLATGTGSAGPISSDPVGSAIGSVVTHSLLAAPSALLSGSTNRAIQYTVFNGGTQNVTSVQLLTPPNAFTVSGSPFTQDTSGWTQTTGGRGYTWTAPNTAAQLVPGATKTFTLYYSRVGPVTAQTNYAHRFVLTQTDRTTVRVETTVTLFVARAIPEVTSVVALSQSAKNTLIWNNPVDHDGVLVLRAMGAAPNTPPVAGTRYPIGWLLGNATVVYTDSASFTSSYPDTGVINGTRYLYKVYNHDEFFLYSPGNVPSSTGLLAIPTAAPGAPAWCYSVGMFTLQQPYTDFGVGVYSSSQARAVTGNRISADPTLDGTELWRPASTSGVTQSRPTVTPLVGRSGMYLVAGDQSGFTYAIDVSNGSTVWKGIDGGSFGAVQAQAAVQLAQYTSVTSDAGIAYRTKYPNTDLVFFGTRTASRTGNSIWALSGFDGTSKWSVTPGDLDIISGGMVVDYETNRLWVASRAGAGGLQPSLRAIDILNPTAVPISFQLGDIDNAVVRNASLREIHVVTNAGIAYGFDATTMAQRWTYNLGGPVSGYLVPVVNGFIASTANGVQLYKVVTSAVGDGGVSRAVFPQWPNPTSPVATAIVGPSAARLDSSSIPYKVYVSDSSGKVNRLSFATGALETSLVVSNMGLGMPSIDPLSSPKRLYVGGQDGRLCAVNLPF